MKCVLMNKNVEVAELEFKLGNIYSIIKEFDSKYYPFVVTTTNEKEYILSQWWNNRCIPASRDKLRQGLANLGYTVDGHLSNPTFLLEKNYGLSLSDQYWLKPEDSNLEWQDINYFTNEFSDDVGKALFDNHKVYMPDFNSPCNSLNGWLKKKWAIVGGKRCLVKGGSFYHQEPFNEVIASEICDLLEIPHTKYHLVISENNNVYSVCDNFINENSELVSAAEIKCAIKIGDNVSSYEHFSKCCEQLNIPDYSNSLDEMLVLDYIMGNQDRHYGNFGVIRNIETLEFTGFAPIFDTGTSLRYDTPSEEIDVCLDVASLPFKSFHSEQIQLVKNPDRFELSKLKHLPALAKEILSTGGVLKEQRVDVLTKVLEARVGMLDKALCKGLQNIPLDLTEQPDVIPPPRSRGR